MDATFAVENMAPRGGKIFIVPESGHHLYVQGAEYVNDLILKFESGRDTILSPVKDLKQLETLKRASSFSIS